MPGNKVDWWLYLKDAVCHTKEFGYFLEGNWESQEIGKPGSLMIIQINLESSSWWQDMG